MRLSPSLPILLLLLLAAKAAADPGPSPWPPLLFASNTPHAGEPTGLEVIGDRVYLATRETLAAFDLANPAQPRFLGVSLTSGSTQRFTVSDNHAFLVGYHAGLDLHDLSNPTRGLPRVGGFSLTGSQSLTGVGVSGHRVFLSGHGTGLLVLDASNPAEPVLEGRADHDLGSTDYFAAEHIRVVGDLIYLAGHDDDWGAFLIYRDVVGEPEFLGEFRVFDLPGTPPTGSSRRLEVKGNVAYVADSGVGLFMLDVSDPTAPRQLFMPNGDELLTYAPVSDFALSGDLLVATDNQTFSVIDVSSPAAPVRRGDLELGDLRLGSGFRTMIAAAGATAYVAGNQRLAVIDFSDPDQPTVRGSIPISGRRAQDVQIAGDLGYVVGEDGIGVFDLTAPVPVEVGLGGIGFYQSLEIDDNRAAARQTSSASIDLYDLGPEGRTPVLRKSLPLGSIRQYDLAANRLYVGRPNQGIFTYEVSNLAQPAEIAHWLDAAQPVDYFQVRGTTLFAGSSRLGFAIFDFNDPDLPSLLGNLPGPEVSHFVLDGPLAYAIRWRPASSDRELLVIDLSDFSSPRLIGATNAPTASAGIADLTVANGFVFAALDYGEPNAWVFDVSDPAQPVFVRSGVSNGVLDHLDARRDLLYVANGYLGLRVFDASLEVPRLAVTRIPEAALPILLSWDAPEGIPFPIEGSRNLRDWTPLGRLTEDDLEEAVGALYEAGPALPAFFRATAR